MAKNKKDNPIAIYAVASQIGLIVTVPLLIFVIGGSWLVDRLDWAPWLKIVFVAIGIATMALGGMQYLKKLIVMFDKDESGTGASEIKHDHRDHDYYDTNRKSPKI